MTHVFNVSVIQLLPLDHVAISASAGTGSHERLAGAEHHDAYDGIALRRVFRNSADRAPARAGPTGRTWFRSRIFPPVARCAKIISVWARTTERFFNIPINVPGGTGPNQGRFGTLGRDAFRGPGFHDFDFAVVKDTPFGHRGNAEFGNIEFRAEFFNMFNIVNFGLPSNILRGSGFGIISKTAGNSRQIQFSLKLIY